MKICECHKQILDSYKWNNSSGYFVRWGGKKNIYLHREIMDAPKGLSVDHINGNRSDNRCSNLRICTHAENMANMRGHKNSTSKFKGVSWSNTFKKWEVKICHKYKKMHLGLFNDEKEAAKAYNKKAIELRGNFAFLNKGVV